MIVGLGETGMSYARYLHRAGLGFAVLDDAPSPSKVRELHELVPGMQVKPVTGQALFGAEDIYVSPGVPLRLPPLARAAEMGATLHGDVAMFGQLASVPIIAITGANGKSTVSELLYQMAAEQRQGVCLAGNIGMPCLDVLDEDASLYVLEVSSFQLELAPSLHTAVAVVLNLSPDHLDRYRHLHDYYETKLNLYQHADALVINRDLGYPLPDLAGRKMASFGLQPGEDEGHFGIIQRGDAIWLMQGDQMLLASDQLQITGTHNLLNVLAGLAMGWLLGLDMAKMISTAKTFQGLPHRCEPVAEHDGILFVNDSKATNPGALVAAVAGQARGRNVHLIAGGVSKGINFDDVFDGASDGIVPRLQPHVKTIMLIGSSREKLQQSFRPLPSQLCADLDDAVQRAYDTAVAGDVILLSPGCASFDAYRNYAERGEAFRRAVMELIK